MLLGLLRYRFICVAARKFDAFVFLSARAAAETGSQLAIEWSEVDRRHPAAGFAFCSARLPIFGLSFALPEATLCLDLGS